MIENIQYINLREVLARVLDHPMLQDVNLESAIRYSLDFIRKMGLPEVYLEKVETIEVENYRGKLPCDLIIVNRMTQICVILHFSHSVTLRTTIPSRRMNASSVAKPICGNMTRLGASNNGLSSFNGGSVP